MKADSSNVKKTPLRLAARAAQLTDPDPHLNRELSCNEDLAERSSEDVSDDSENFAEG